MQVLLEGHDLKTDTGCRRIRAQYWGNVTLVDRAMGLILSTLDECALTDNTIVVFTSDHGDMLGDHGMFSKCVLYEEAIKVPLIVRVPWLCRTQQLVKGRISQIDLVPTLLDLMGEPIPGNLEGESRVAVLRGEATLDRNSVFIEWNGRDSRPPWRSIPSDIPLKEWDRVSGPWRTIVTGDGWKLNLSLEDQCELYDLNADPYEQRNLFDDPKQKEYIRSLCERIHAWQERSEDDAVLPRV